MRLIKPKKISLLNFAITKVPETGKQTYMLLLTEEILASVMPFKVALMPDFQVDLARIKDHWILYSNQEIKTDQTVVVKIKDRYYLPVYNEDTKYLDPRDGFYKTVVKLNVTQAYGLP